MILPGKHLRPDRALLGIGSEILATLEEDRTVSEVWELVKERRNLHATPISFDWFVLSLSFLHAIRALSFDAGVLTRRGE